MNAHKICTETDKFRRTFPKCGEWIEDFQFAAIVPDCFDLQKERVKNASLLCEHVCAYKNKEGKHRFVRANIEFPIIGEVSTIKLGIWTKLSWLDFKHFQATSALPDGYASYMGTLCNDIPGFGLMYGQKVLITLSKHSDYPSVKSMPPDDPLSYQMVEGISVEDAQLIIEIMDSVSHWNYEPEMVAKD